MDIQKIQEGSALQLSSETFVNVTAVVSLSDAVQCELPSIARMRKEQGESETKKMMAALIDRCQSLMNLTMKMNTEQLQDAVDIMCSEYYWMTFADLNAILTQGRMGRYGELFGRIDTTTLCKWCEKYLAERANYFEKLNNNEHYEHKRIK